MISVNKVILCGYLGNDPEVKGRESSFVSLSVSTSKSWKNKQSGQRESKTEWHKVTVFNETAAKFLAEYAKKGDKVYVEGEIETRSYEQNGEKKYITEVIVPKFTGVVQLDSKKDRDESGSRERDEDRGGRYGSQSDFGQSRPGGFSRELDDEIPF